MAEYSSNDVSLKGKDTDVFNKLSDPSALKSFLNNVPLEQIPEDKRAVLDKIRLSDDRVVISGGPAGDMTLKVSGKKEPSYVRYDGIGLPVKLALVFKISPVDNMSSRCSVTIDADIPAMLRPMIGGTLQKAADQFAMMLASIPAWD